MNSVGFWKAAAVEANAYRFTKTPAVYDFFCGLS